MTQEEIILQRFSTERFKRFWYPTRPLFTLSLGILLAATGFVGILPMSWALWLSAAFAFDDLPLTPIMNIVTAVNNLYHERKQIKSMIKLALISLSAIIGGLLAFFVLSQSAVFMGLIIGFINATSCSPLLISLGAIVGGLIAHTSKKLSPFMGILIGCTLMAFISPPIPLMVEVVFMSAASLAFITSILTKQALRIYYKYAYGHSNADGYYLDIKDIGEHYNNQAKKFSLEPEVFKKIIGFCKDRIEKTKNEASYWNELSGERQNKSNPLKDIYHGLMGAKTEEEVRSAKVLLKASTASEITTHLSNVDLQSQIYIKSGFPAPLAFSKLEKRTFFNQIWLEEGKSAIPSEVISPREILN